MYNFPSIFFTATIIAEALLKSFYSRKGFKVIKYSATSPNFEEAHKKFHYESGKSKSLQNQTIGLRCHLTIPRCVTIIHENRIDFNENRDVFKDLNDIPPSDDSFPYEYIYAEVKKKVDETKGKLAGHEMEKETKHYVESLNHDPNWLRTITIEIDKFLIDREYIDFFMQMTCSRPRRTFFYTRSHLSALQNCALLFSSNFQFIFIPKKCIIQFSH